MGLYVGDHPRLFPANRNQALILDAAYTDEAALIERLEQLLGGEVQRLKVKKVDLVANSTSVDVRFRLDSTRASNRSEVQCAPGMQRNTANGPVN